MVFITDPDQDTGCTESTQFTICFKNGYRAGINDLSEVNGTLMTLLDNVDFLKCPIEPSGIFEVVDVKRKSVLSRMYYKYEFGVMLYTPIAVFDNKTKEIV